MTTAQAILHLRTKLGLSQRKFATLSGLGLTSIVRFEGGDEPAPKALRKLALLSEENGLSWLADLFSAKLRGEIAGQIESLPSPGTSRRVSLDDLESWSNGWLRGSVLAALDSAISKLEGLPLTPSGRVEMALDQLTNVIAEVKGARGVADWVAGCIGTYIDGSVPKGRPPKKTASK